MEMGRRNRMAIITQEAIAKLKEDIKEEIISQYYIKTMKMLVKMADKYAENELTLQDINKFSLYMSQVFFDSLKKFDKVNIEFVIGGNENESNSSIEKSHIG